MAKVTRQDVLDALNSKIEDLIIELSDDMNIELLSKLSKHMVESLDSKVEDLSHVLLEYINAMQNEKE